MEIVTAAEARLRQLHRRRRTVYRREWSIGVGSSRIDLAAINGQITGCEIKSGRDNFRRLQSQMKFYSEVVDTALLIAEKPSSIKTADEVLPEWWGIWQATETSSGAVIEVIRDGKGNPAPNALAIAQLVWRDEAYALLQRYSLSDGLRSATRWRLWERMAADIPLNTIRREVREIIKARPDW